ncbi:MAG: tetratricopeptide repeat protein [Verrucomicrobiota bacterium]|nr:tetratricopeptide repeat protein [Verrucomicrobiota bacterium]
MKLQQQAFIFGCKTLSLLLLLLLPACSHTRNSSIRSKPQIATPASQAALPPLSDNEISALAHFATGLSNDLNQKPDVAAEEYAKSAESDPSHEPIVIEAARRLIRLQQGERAVELLRKASERKEASGTLLAWLGLAYAQTGKTNEAILANQAAIRKMPANLPAVANMAQLYMQNGKTNEALQTLEIAAAQSSKLPEYWAGLAEIFARYQRQQVLDDSDAKKKIGAALDKAVALNPNDPMLRQRIAEGYLMIGDPARAEVILAKLEKEFPDMPGIRERLANIYLRGGKKERAAEILESLRKENPTNPQPYLFLGALASEQKKFAEAAEFYETALQLNPTFEQLYYDLAGVYITIRKPKEALEVLGRARVRFKLNFLTEFYSGVAQSMQENYKAALNHYTSAELLAKAADSARLTPQFYYQVGAASERTGNLEQAETYFRKALQLDPEYSEAMNYMGYMWAERGERLEEALSLIQKAIKLEPKNPAYLDSLAWVFYKLNQYEEALKWMRQAIEYSEEPDATLYDHLGDILAALKKWDEARDAWRKSIELQPNETIKNKLSQPASSA